jgi:hypothetical protein
MQPITDPAIIAKQQRWRQIVTEHTASFEEIIRLASRYPRDILLGGLKRKAEAGLAQLRREDASPYISSQPHGYGSIGTWGPNGQGPRIRKMLSDARWHVAQHDAVASGSKREAA